MDKDLELLTEEDWTRIIMELATARGSEGFTEDEALAVGDEIEGMIFGAALYKAWMAGELVIAGFDGIEILWAANK